MLAALIPADIGSVHALKIEADELVQIAGLIIDFEVGDMPAEKTMSVLLIFRQVLITDAGFLGQPHSLFFISAVVSGKIFDVEASELGPNLAVDALSCNLHHIFLMATAVQ